MAEQTVTLEPGQSKKVTFEATPTVAKTYQVSVNGLSGSFKAVGVPVALVPCVYCGATFTSENELIAHMESNHPGKPYLVSAYLPQPYVLYGDFNTAPFSAKGYVPDTQYYQFLTYIYWDAFAGGVSIKRKPAGFYEVGASIRSYGVTGPPPHYIYVPRGTYAIKTSCARIVDTSIYWLWKGKDTGLTIEVI